MQFVGACSGGRWLCSTEAIAVDSSPVSTSVAAILLIADLPITWIPAVHVRLLTENGSCPCLLSPGEFCLNLYKLFLLFALKLNHRVSGQYNLMSNIFRSLRNGNVEGVDKMETLKESTKMLVAQ